MTAVHLNVTIRQLTDSIADQPAIPTGRLSEVSAGVMKSAAEFMRLRPEQRQQIMTVITQAAEAA